MVGTQEGESRMAEGRRARGGEKGRRRGRGGRGRGEQGEGMWECGGRQWEKKGVSVTMRYNGSGAGEGEWSGQKEEVRQD